MRRTWVLTFAIVSLLLIGELHADARSRHGTHAKVHEHLQTLSRQHEAYMRSHASLVEAHDNFAKAQERLDAAAASGKALDSNESKEIEITINNLMNKITSHEQVISSMKATAQKTVEALRQQ